LRQTIPLDRTRPGWDGGSSVLFACDHGNACHSSTHDPPLPP